MSPSKNTNTQPRPDPPHTHTQTNTNQSNPWSRVSRAVVKHLYNTAHETYVSGLFSPLHGQEGGPRETAPADCERDDVRYYKARETHTAPPLYCRAPSSGHSCSKGTSRRTGAIKPRKVRAYCGWHPPCAFQSHLPARAAHDNTCPPAADILHVGWAAKGSQGLPMLLPFRGGQIHVHHVALCSDNVLARPVAPC